MPELRFIKLDQWYTPSAGDYAPDRREGEELYQVLIRISRQDERTITFETRTRRGKKRFLGHSITIDKNCVTRMADGRLMIHGPALSYFHPEYTM